jgi:predicted amidophosphoribosyltransferase
VNCSNCGAHASAAQGYCEECGTLFQLEWIEIVADVQKHKTHESHRQFCDCLGQCAQYSVQAVFHAKAAQGR